MNKNTCKCSGFELDKSLGSHEDKPCCQICKFFNSTADDCLLGDDYPDGGEED